MLYWTLCEYIYIPYYKVASSDKDQETKIYKLLRKQGAIEVIKPKGNPYQKRAVNNPFHQMENLMREILYKHPISLISVLGAACHSAHSCQGLLRNRGFKRDRKQHTGILLLNIPWHPSSSAGKESASSAGALGSIPGLGRYPEGGHGNPLQYSGESPWTEEPSRLQSMGSQRVKHD